MEPHSIMLLRHGSVFAQGWWAPFAPSYLHALRSISKTFTATALGFAVAEGLVGLDDPVIAYFPEFANEVPARSRAILVRHAAAMATGHDGDMAQAAIVTDRHEPVRGLLLHEPECEPGTVFAYNQPATYAIAAIVQRRAGVTIHEYLRPRVLEPLGIEGVVWQEYPAGRNLGFSGLFTTTDAVAKLGLLYLLDGRWEGRQLLPAGWAGQVRARHVSTLGEAGLDWQQGYGFQMWQSRHGYRADGAFGQFCLVLPDHDAVVVMTASTQAMQDVLDLVWRHLLPAFGDGPITPTAVDEALQVRLARLALPAPGGSSRPPSDASVGLYRVLPGTTSAAGAPRVAHLERDGDAWFVSLQEDGVVLRLPVPGGRWVTVRPSALMPPLATAGGWREGALRLDVLFLQTPHRLHLVLHPDRRLETRWRAAPHGLFMTELPNLRTFLAGQPRVA